MTARPDRKWYAPFATIERAVDCCLVGLAIASATAVIILSALG